MIGNLKPYRVGEYDMVAAENAEQALKLLVDNYDFCDADEITIDDVADMSSHLYRNVWDEDGNNTGTLYSYVKACNGVPQYLYGWEQLALNKMES